MLHNVKVEDEGIYLCNGTDIITSEHQVIFITLNYFIISVGLIILY